MKSIVAVNTQRMVLILAIAMAVAIPAIATLKSRRASMSAGCRAGASGDLTSHVVPETIRSPLRELANAVANPNLPDSLQVPGRGSVKDLRELGYCEDEINQMWQSFQERPSAHTRESNSLPGWSQWQNPYGAILP